MREILSRAFAVTSLELARIRRTPATFLAITGFLVLLLIGQWMHWRAVPPRPDGDRLFAYAFLMACMVGLRFGLSSDRKLRIDHSLVGNLVRPVELYLGKSIACAASLVVLTIGAMITALLASVGDWEFALWYPTIMALAVWTFTPLLVLVELGMDTRYPGLAAFVLLVVITTVLSATIGATTVARWLAFDFQRYDYTTLVPLVGRALVATGILGLLYPLWRWRLGPLR